MSILFAILALGLLVALHEAGHYLAARWCGMRVHEFAIGFGPKIVSFVHNGTQFTIRAIFLGGYVRVAGMYEGDDDADDEKGFLRSPAWKRITMILAGPIANYLTAIVLFALIFMVWGQRDSSVRVKQVGASSALAKAGLKPTDRLLLVDGESVSFRQGLSHAQMLQGLLALRGEKAVAVKVQRGDKVLTLTLPKFSGKLEKPDPYLFPEPGDEAEEKKAAKGKKPTKQYLGLRMRALGVPMVAVLAPTSEAFKAGLRSGDKILKVGTIAYRSTLAHFRLQKLIRSLKQQRVELLVSRKGLTEPVKLMLQASTLSKVKWKTAVRLKVERVVEVSIAAKADFKSDDVILSVNGTKPYKRAPRTQREHLRQMLGQCTQKALQLKIHRDGKFADLTLPKQKKAEDCTKGLDLHFSSWVLVTGFPSKTKTTAKRIGLKLGDRLMEVDGQPLNSIPQLKELLKRRLYRPVSLKILRDGKMISKQAPVSEDGKRYLLGFYPMMDYHHHRTGLLSSIRIGIKTTWNWNVKIWNGLKKIFKGKEKANFTGPVGIISMANQAVRHGFNYFISFVAVISIHLAFFNLLPIPALDGGRILFIFGQQLVRLVGIDEKRTWRAEMVLHFVGFVLLFSMLIWVTYKDIGRLVSRFFQ